MADTVTTPTLTIRIPAEVKAQLESSAISARQSITDFVVRSIEQRIAGSCHACGRDAAAPTVPPAGHSPAFEDWCNQVRKLGHGEPRVALATNEPNGAFLYVGSVMPSLISESYVSVGIGQYLVPVARQHIVMWEIEKHRLDHFIAALVNMRGFRLFEDMLPYLQPQQSAPRHRK